MQVDEVITLDDGKEFVLLSQTMYENEKYFLASMLLNNEPTDNYTIFKEVNDNGEIYVDEILDQKLKDELTMLFEQAYDEAENE